MTQSWARSWLFLLACAAPWACDEAPPAEDPAPATPRPPQRDNPCKQPGDLPAFCDGGVALPSGKGCAYQLANGVCDPGPDGDSCDCIDCVDSATCTGRCVDDGACKLGPGAEDCTCVDCHRVVAACSPPSVGCKNDGVCSPTTDDCTCADCQSLAACSACVTNGECVPYLEGCNCADCEDALACQGGAGAGGAGGSGTAGKAGGT